VTDPQPNKTHIDTTQPRLNQISSQVSTNHMRVHDAHDCEHDCYNSFTLYRGCTRSPWVMIIPRRLNTRCTGEHPYTLPRCVLQNHYNVVQWFHLACNVPTEVSPPVWASHPPRSPPLMPYGFQPSQLYPHHPTVQPSQHHWTYQWFYHRSFPAQPVDTPRLNSTTYYARSYPYKLIVVLFSWVVAPWTGL
jgi:hypothetical protein